MLVTDSGLETDLIFHHARTCRRSPRSRCCATTTAVQLLEQYFREHLETAAAHGFGAVVETPTWRASADWAEPVGWSVADVLRSNLDAVELVADVRYGVRRGRVLSWSAGASGRAATATSWPTG